MTLSQRAVEAARKVLEDEFAGTLNLEGVAERMLTAALAVDGLCLVPKEPTQAMIDAGGVALATEFTDPWDALSEEEERVFGLEVGSFDEAGKRLTVFIEPAWKAMLAAANDEEERK